MYYNLLCLACFFLHNVFEIYLYCVYISFFLLLNRIPCTS